MAAWREAAWWVAAQRVVVLRLEARRLVVAARRVAAWRVAARWAAQSVVRAERLLARAPPGGVASLAWMAHWVVARLWQRLPTALARPVLARVLLLSAVARAAFCLASPARPGQLSACGAHLAAGVGRTRKPPAAFGATRAAWPAPRSRAAGGLASKLVSVHRLPRHHPRRSARPPPSARSAPRRGAARVGSPRAPGRVRAAKSAGGCPASTTRAPAGHPPSGIWRGSPRTLRGPWPAARAPPGRPHSVAAH